MEEKLKILSIDGGGIKGLYSLYVLQKIEEKYNIKANKFFDLFCGTSTGGIISLGLAHGKTVDELIEFYEKEGKKIFPHKNKHLRNFHRIKSLLVKSRYSDVILKAALEEVFGEYKIKDLKKHVCIPTVDLMENSPVVIKTPHQPSRTKLSERWTRDGGLKICDVALATAAAPTYFPIAKLEGVGSLLSDGGLFANNPTLIGVVESLEHFVGENKGFSKMDILSLGNIVGDSKFGSDFNRRASLLKWEEKVINTTLTAQVKSINYIMNFFKDNPLYKIDGYLRIEEERVEIGYQKHIDLDNCSDESIDVLKEFASKKVNGLKAEDKRQLEKIFV